MVNIRQLTLEFLDKLKIRLKITDLQQEHLFITVHKDFKLKNIILNVIFLVLESFFIKCYLQKFLGMPFVKAPYLFYPRIYCLTDVFNAVGQQYEQNDEKQVWGHFTDETCTTLVKPAVLEARQETFGKALQVNAIVMDNGEYISLYFGSLIPQEFTKEVSAKYL